MNTKASGTKVRATAGIARSAVSSVGVLVCTFWLNALGKTVEPGSTITLRVANYAQVPHGVLAAAERSSQRLLHEAGVGSIWHERPLAAAKIGYQSPPGPADFFLTVVSKVMPERRSEQDALGLALPCPQGKGGCLAYIFYSRIETMATDGDASLSDILAHAMTHEIGHLLMGPPHSSTGIMRGEWTRKTSGTPRSANSALRLGKLPSCKSPFFEDCRHRVWPPRWVRSARLGMQKNHPEN